MDLNTFAKKREFLYHLTDERNLNSIFESGMLKSTAKLVTEANLINIKEFLGTRREYHCPIKIGKFEIILRDQYPLNRKIVMKNLTKGWVFEDFVRLLNARVFFWSTKGDLEKHYKRYETEDEFPKILRMRTTDLFSLNQTKPQFCMYNSGGPRCHNAFKEGAAPRGENTFLENSRYEGGIGSVREVTFLKECKLPDTIWISDHPSKPFILTTSLQSK